MGSNWNEAVQRLVEDVSTARARVALEDRLRCPHCGEMNRPGAHLIELEASHRAVCGVCATAFNPCDQETT